MTSSSSATTMTSSSSLPPSSPASTATTSDAAGGSNAATTMVKKNRKALQAQSIRFLRCHSLASLRSSVDGEELGTEKIKALVEKFKLDVEKRDNESTTAIDSGDSSTSDSSAADDDTVPTKATTAATVIATNEQVRSKLLNRLGIQSSVVQPEANPRPRMAIPREPAFELPLNDAGDFENWEQRKLLVKRKPFSFFGQSKSSDSNVTESSAQSSASGTAESKENKESTTEVDETATTTTAQEGLEESLTKDKVSEETMAAQPPPRKGVRFNATVKAHSIPSHTVYSKRIKQTIWSSAQELEENVARNCYEFEAENWNFDDVVDEDGMIWYHGQWVHPVHFADFPSTSQTKETMQ